MKRLCITYHMEKMLSKPSDWPRCTDTAETCITLSMLDEIADDILKNQAGSKYIISLPLGELAKIQGYPSAVFVMAEAE